MSPAYWVLGGYLVLLMGLGMAGMLRGKGTEEDYYLAGRGQGMLVTSLTIMATFFSGFAMLAFPGWVYLYGIPPMLLALNLPVAACAIFVIGNRVRKLGAAKGFVTPSDLVSDYYGGGMWIRGLVALTGFLYALPYVIIQIKAGGHLAQGLFGGVEAVEIFGLEVSMYDAGASALAVVTMLYVIVGGMRSVAWTDVVQGVLLLSAMVLSGVAIVNVMGGVGGYFEKVSELPKELLVMPEAPGRFNVWWAMGYCAFASLASVIHPGQWMRFYAARDGKTLRRTAVVFAVVLPVCFLFGVFLVGLGGRVLYPVAADGSLPEVLGSANQIAVVVIREHFPVLFGQVGVWLVAVILVAIMAASMSTADSNLHALSAVATRDGFDRVRPKASEREKAWFGRGVIVVATLFALGLSFLGERHPEMGLLRTIEQFFLLAMAFAAQLLPVAVDVLFLRRGTGAGAVAGLVAGLVTVFLFTPFPAMMFGEGTGEWTAVVRAVADVGMVGMVLNVIVFCLVSRFSKKVPSEKIEEYAGILTSGEGRATEGGDE